MPIGVIRFGGNSFYNESALKSFSKEIKNSDQKLVIVVSAVPKIHQAIKDGLNKLTSHSISYDQIISQVLNEINAIKSNNIKQSEFETKLLKKVGQLENLLNGIQLTGDFSALLKDSVLSYAEKISSYLLAGILAEDGLNANILSPEEINFRVTDEYGNATALIDQTQQINSNGFEKVNLIPGSFGVGSENKIARLGDNASDYSAAALTKLLGAESLELWNIDESFRTGNEHIVSGSAIIERLTYEEASELSYFSHSSLHPRIVEPLIEDHIPIKVFHLTSSGKQLETIINSETYISANVVKSVVHDDDIAILKLNGPGVGFKPGILAKVTGTFHQAGINIRSVITSQVSINIILNKSEVKTAREICNNLDLTSVNELIIQDDVSLVAVVGHGMQTHHGVSAKLFNAVADHKINVLLSGSGASDLASYLIINQKDKEKAIKEIHNIFLAKEIIQLD